MVWRAAPRRRLIWMGRLRNALGTGALLLLGIGLVPEQIPQQRIEEAREEKGKKGGESGAPPL